MNIINIIGDNIRGFRKKRKWTQARLGAECKMNGNYIGDLERGEFNVTVIKLLRLQKLLKQVLTIYLSKRAINFLPNNFRRNYPPKKTANLTNLKC